MEELKHTYLAVRWGARGVYWVHIRLSTFTVNEYVATAYEYQDVKKWKITLEVNSSARVVSLYTNKYLNKDNVQMFATLCDNMEIGCDAFLFPQGKSDLVYENEDVALEYYNKAIGYLTASARVLCDTFPDLEFDKGR